MVPKIHRIFRSRFPGLLAAIFIFITACSPAAGPVVTPSVSGLPTRSGNLTPYQTLPAQRLSTPPPSTGAPTATIEPSPTATPRLHVVKKGEDMGGIAWQYRVSLEALMAANPTVQPHFMSIGTQLVIPPAQTQSAPESAAAGAAAAAAGSGADENPPTPTALPAAQGSIQCARVEEGGLWCFLPLTNAQPYPMEGLTGVFRLTDPQSQTVVSQMAYLPLDRLEPEASLPLTAYFTPEQVGAIAPPYQVSGELSTALPGADDGRYHPTHLENQNVMIAENGLSAIITADVILDGGEQANRVWVAAVAYDAQGNVVGVRRWEKPADQPLVKGQALPLTMHVYSTSAKIERVALHAEARP